MPPPHEVVDDRGANFLPAHEQPEHLVAEELLDGLDLRPGRDPEHVPAVESSVCKQDVTMRVELEQALKVCTAMTAPGWASVSGKTP